MPKKQAKIKIESLPPRERQVLDAVYRLSEAGVGDVLEAMENPPGYSAVRATLNVLVQKGFLQYRNEKNRYLYRPVLPMEKAPRSILRNLVDTFFAGRPTAAVAALLDVGADDLTDDDLEEMEAMIRRARKEQKLK